MHLPGHELHQQKIFLQKHTGNFHFLTQIPLVKPNTTVQSSEIRQNLLLRAEKTKWAIHGDDIKIRSEEYDQDHKLKLLRGRIHSLHSVGFIENRPAFYRAMIPLTARIKNLNKFADRPFTLDYGPARNLVEIRMMKRVFHVYDIRVKHLLYLIIDSLTTTPFEEFKKCCDCIILSCAALAGPFNTATQGFVFSYKDTEMQLPTGIQFLIMHKFTQGSFSLFKTVPVATSDQLLSNNNSKSIARLIHDSKKSFDNFSQSLYSDEELFDAILHYTCHKISRSQKNRSSLSLDL